MVIPWRMITGAEPYTMKVVRAVLNGGREETYSNATRLAPTQLPRSRFRQRLRPGVDMTSDVKGWEQLFYVCIMFFPLCLSEEPEPGRHDG